jgi:hypothetical protein
VAAAAEVHPAAAAARARADQAVAAARHDQEAHRSLAVAVARPRSLADREAAAHRSLADH